MSSQSERLQRATCFSWWVPKPGLRLVRFRSFSATAYNEQITQDYTTDYNADKGNDMGAALRQVRAPRSLKYQTIYLW